MPPSSRRLGRGAREGRGHRLARGVERAVPVGVQLQDPERDCTLLQREGEHPLHTLLQCQRAEAGPPVGRQLQLGHQDGSPGAERDQGGPLVGGELQLGHRTGIRVRGGRHTGSRIVGHQVHRRTPQNELVGDRATQALQRGREPREPGVVPGPRGQRAHEAASFLGPRHGRLGAVHAGPSTWPGQAPHRGDAHLTPRPYSSCSCRKPDLRRTFDVLFVVPDPDDVPCWCDVRVSHCLGASPASRMACCWSPNQRGHVPRPRQITTIDGTAARPPVSG